MDHRDYFSIGMLYFLKSELPEIPIIMIDQDGILYRATEEDLKELGREEGLK